MDDTDADGMRRRLLIAASAFGAAQLAGCSSWCPRETMPSFQAARSLAPLVAVTPESLGVGQSPVIDAHAHFFNARDVQVLGFLTGPVAHSRPEMADLIRAVGPLVEKLSYLAPTPAEELTFLQHLNDQASRMSARALSEAFEAEARQRREVRLREFHRILNADPSFREQYMQVTGFRTKAPTDEIITLEELTHAAARGTAWDPGDARALDVRSANAEGVLRFALLMLNYRVDNVYSFQGSYSEREDSAGIAGAVDALVEFNYWLGHPCKASRMLDQVKLHEHLVRLSGGFLLPLVGYNPATDIMEKGAAIEVVKAAITQYGCIGVKIYPPNGYLPFGNKSAACRPARGYEPWQEGKALDDRLKEVYEFCDSQGVPVMSHANESMGKDDAHDRLAGVCGWRTLAVAEEVSLSSLRINAGHFGGDENDNDWTSEFVRLMAVHPRLQVYADLGYWDALGSSDAARERLRNALNQKLPDGTRVVDRVMYGSDWLMMSQEDAYERFPVTVRRVLDQMDLSSDDVARVMGRNALSCFRLRPGDKNFERFAKHYGDRVMKQAAWATLA
jgi:predicted TIM-barrel fold metal-dependent hydrolase